MPSLALSTMLMLRSISRHCRSRSVCLQRFYTNGSIRTTALLPDKTHIKLTREQWAIGMEESLHLS